MCCICSCFAAVLDVIQRTITFVLACWLACVVCCGLLFASAAGVAYGYNYSMAEFISLTRSDVTVFLRRGKFYDDPELKYRPHAMRKSGGDAFEGDEFAANMKAEYEESQRNAPPAERRSLSEAWVKAEDTRKYAEWMTKFGGGARRAGGSLEGQVDTSVPSAIVPDMDSSTPTRTPATLYVSRTEVSSSSTQMHMRRFMPDAIGKWRRTLKPPDVDKSEEIFNLGYGDDITNTRKKDDTDIVSVADDKKWSTSAEGHIEELYQEKIETPI